MSDKIIKFLPIADLEIKSIDEEKKIIWHKISSEVVDRMGDIVRIDGIKTKEFEKKPSVLYGHDYGFFGSMAPLSVIGSNIGFRKKEKFLYAGTQFLNTDTDKISQGLKDLVNDNWYLHQEKLLGWSIGFIALKTEEIKDKDGTVTGLDFKECELLEYSSVIIPANQDAVDEAFRKGMVSKECVEGMACFIEKQEFPGDVATRKIEEEKYAEAVIETAQAVIATLPTLPGTKEEKNDSQTPGITPDLIKALQRTLEALKNSQKLLAVYLRKSLGGNKHG